MAFTYLDRALFYAGKHPLQSVLLLLVLQIAALALLEVMPSEWLSIAPALTLKDQWSHFVSIWTIQATVVALVYPIVIAFAAMFLQRRPTAEAFVHLYILYSGALAAGLSSLVLVMWMGIQHIALTYYWSTLLTSLLALDAAWLILNMALTSLFLYRTVRFLRTDIQSQVAHRYVANVALPREVSELYAVHLMLTATKKGWLPFPAYGDSEADEGPRLLIGTSFQEGESQGDLHVRKPSRLVDVRLWLIRTVVSAWFKTAYRHPRPEPNRLTTNKGWPLLSIPAPIGAETFNVIRLAEVLNGPALSRRQRWLLHRSLVLRRASWEGYAIRVRDILAEMASEAREAASRGDRQRFEQAYDKIIEMHNLLIAASLLDDESDETDSWALLSDGQSLFGHRTLHENWLDIYRLVFEAAIEGMANDTRPVRQLSHLLSRLDNDTQRASPVKIQEQLLRLPALLMFHLEGWWNRRVEEQGDMAHSAERMVELRLPLNRVYDEVLSEFVAGWEGARRTWGSFTSRGRIADWDSGPRLASLNAKHVEETARMLLAATYRGDRAAAEWLADVLSKWWATFDYNHEPFQLYGRSAFITLEHLQLEWSECCKRIGIQQPVAQSGVERSVAQSEEAALQYGVYLAALRNYWADIRLVSIELMIGWILKKPDAVSADSLALAVTIGLLTGKEWKSGGSTVGSLGNMTADEYLTAKARQYGDSGTWRGGYIERLDRFVQSVGLMSRPSMVSGRTYIMTGPDGVESLRDAQLLLFGSTSRSRWGGASRDLQQQLAVWMDTQPRSLEILFRRCTEWLAQLETESHAPYKFLELLRQHIRPTWGQPSDWGIVKEGLQSVQKTIDDLREEFLAKEPVSSMRLREIGIFASVDAFSAERGVFPMQFFKVDRSSGSHIDFTLTIPQVRKGELTQRPVDQPPSNENSYYANTMAHHVAIVVLGDTLHRCAIRDTPAFDADMFWKVLKEGASEITERGGRPILLVGTGGGPQWVADWRHVNNDAAHQRPEDMRVRREGGHGRAYICHFNNIALYRAPIPQGQSFLLSEEAFHRVTFREYEAGRFVDVKAAETTGSPNTLDLKLTFSRQVEVGDIEVVRMLYTETDE